MSLAYIALGANLGDAQQTILAAFDALACLPQTALLQRSSLYGSAPVDSSGDDYINAVAQIRTSLAPEALLQALQAIELANGRERPYRNAPRTLDLDILLYDDNCIAAPHLQIPHPRMTERAFVLLPLLEIAADITVPGKGSASAFLPLVADQRICKLSAH